MFQVFFTHVLDQDEERIRFAVLRETTVTSLDEIPLLPTTYSERYILARDPDTGEKAVFACQTEKFVTTKAKDIRLIKGMYCGRCSSTGLYQGPTGITMAGRIRGVRQLTLQPLCFDCNGKGFPRSARTSA